MDASELYIRIGIQGPKIRILTMRGHKDRSRPTPSPSLYNDRIMAEFLMSRETELNKIAGFYLLQRDLSPKGAGCFFLSR